MVSAAWFAGPPLATLLIGSAGVGAVLVAIAVAGVLLTTTTAAMLSGRPAAPAAPAATGPGPGDRPLPRSSVGLLLIAFVALQATNAAAVSVMALFVTESLAADVRWAGTTLGVAAGLEIPALLLIARLGRRVADLRLLGSGCLAGVAYYVAAALVSSPGVLIALPVLNAWFFATVAGVGLTLFQRVVPRPGLASGLFTNTRRVGAIASGPIIGVGALTVLGYRSVFVVAAVLVLLALVLLVLAGRTARAARPPAG